MNTLKEVSDMLSELNKKLHDQMEIEGSVRTLIDKREQHITECGKALGSLEEAISIKDEILKLKNAMLKLKDELVECKRSKETAEADLKKVQENLQKTLSEFDAAIQRTNHLNKQIDGITSHVQDQEHERTQLVLNIDDLKRQLKDITQASESIKNRMEKRIKHFENYETELREKLDAVTMELVTKDNELMTAENDIREQKTGQKALQLKYENAKTMVDKLTESKENLTTELEQAKEKLLQQVARSEELQSRVRDLESQLAEVHRQLQRKDAEKTQVKSQLNSMVEELQRLDRDSLDYRQQLDELQTQLKHRQDSEAMLEGQLNQAKDDATQLRKLLRQRSEEMKEIKSEREELRHQLATASTPLGHSKGVSDQDSPPTESNEFGMLHIPVYGTGFFFSLTGDFFCNLYSTGVRHSFTTFT